MADSRRQPYASPALPAMKSLPPASFFGLTPPTTGTTPSSTSLSLTPDGLVACPPHALARLRAIRSLDEDSCCSFSEWKSAGYWVKKGSKSYFTDALGISQFTKEQVTKSRW